MGTPGFAAESLKALLNSSHQVVAVITAPDKPAGRGQKLRVSAVKELALQHELKILQPTNLKSEAFADELRNLAPDLAVVVAFRMLPKVVWSIPKYGTLNLHASLLPQYRGAAPINWVLINGETQTGVTTFFINEQIDTGAILKQKAVDISATENAGNLHDKLMTVGAHLIIETLNGIEKGTLEAQAQNFIDDLKAAPKIFKEHLKLDFSKSAKSVYNKIRGLSPYPAAYASFFDGQNELNLKIYAAELEPDNAAEESGTLRSDGKKYLKVAAKNGWLNLTEVQLAGKKRMKIHDFLNGINFSQKMKIS
jgi:methionyl-tRNA formyltransferase